MATTEHDGAKPSLADMDSEQLLRTVRQSNEKHSRQAPQEPDGSHKRSGRKRTKTAKAIEADELEAELDAEEEAEEAQHVRAAPAPKKPRKGSVAAAEPPADTQAAGVPSLFVPADQAAAEAPPGEAAPAADAEVAVLPPAADETAPAAEAAAEPAAVPAGEPAIPAGEPAVPAPIVPEDGGVPPVDGAPAEGSLKVEELAGVPPADGDPLQPPLPPLLDVPQVEHTLGDGKKEKKKKAKPANPRPPQVPTAAIAGTEPLIPFPPPTNPMPPFDPSAPPPLDHAAAEQLLARHMQANLAGAPAPPPPVPGDGADGDLADADAVGDGAPPVPLLVGAPDINGETATKYTGVRRNKGGRYSARIKISGTNKYLGSFKTAEEAARAFDQKAVESGRPVETLNFPAAYGGPTVGQAYRKRKVHKLYGDPQNHINVLLQKLADVDRSNPGILRLTMASLGVPETRYLPDNKYSGIRKQSSHWETRIRYKDKLYSMGFYASVEAAALAWDITAASLRRCRKLNFPEVSFADLEQQLDALKCVIAQVPGNEQIAQMPIPPPHPVPGAADGLALEPPGVAGVDAAADGDDDDDDGAAPPPDADLDLGGPSPPPAVPDAAAHEQALAAEDLAGGVPPPAHDDMDGMDGIPPPAMPVADAAAMPMPDAHMAMDGQGAVMHAPPPPPGEDGVPPAVPGDEVAAAAAAPVLEAAAEGVPPAVEAEAPAEIPQ